MKAHEIADPEPVGLFSTDAVRITVLTCSRRWGLLAPSMAGPILFLYTGVYDRAKRVGQANTLKYQRQIGNVLI